MSARIPDTITLLRSPDRAAVAALDSLVAIARHAVRARHGQLACHPTGDPLDRAARRFLRRLDALDAALDAYVRLDDSWPPVEDDPF